jgi:type IV secretion system protein VirB5
MRFKRATVRYAETPEPVTPYQAAQQAWDERIGSARVQAKNWRLMAFACIGLVVTLSGGLIWQASRSTITPYVVEVDKLGQVKAIGAAAEGYRPNDAQIAYHLSRFIQNVRSLSIDPIVVRQNWLEAYDYTTERGAATLNEYARTNDPFSHVGQTTIAVEMTSVVRVSETSVQLRWVERTYTNGALTNTERWTAILSLVMKQPRDEARLRKNPLGIFVDGLNWSRELANANG